MTSYVRSIREAVQPESEPVWVELPLQGERLSEIVLFGNGKDCDLMVELADGRQFVLGLGDPLRVHGCAGLLSQVLRWDDRSLLIRYGGKNLVIAAFRIGTPSWPDELESFQAEVREWLSTGGTHDLCSALPVEIEITTTDVLSPEPRNR